MSAIKTCLSPLLVVLAVTLLGCGGGSGASAAAASAVAPSAALIEP